MRCDSVCSPRGSFITEEVTQWGDTLGLDSWGPGKFDAQLSLDGDPHPPGLRVGWRQLAHFDGRTYWTRAVPRGVAAPR